MSDTLIDNLKEALNFFVFNFLELTILFLGVSFLVELINLFINPQRVQKLLSSSKSGYLISSSLGALTPFCSCSTIPLTLGLLKARAAFGPIMAFLFTSPLLNPIIVAVFWSAFGYKITLVYSFFAFFVSIFAAYTLDKLGFERFIKKEIFKSDTRTKEASSNVSSFSLKAKDENFCCENTKTSFSVKTKAQAACCSSVEEEPKITSSCCGSTDEEKETNKKVNKWKKISDKALIKKTWKQFLSFAPYIALGIGIGAFVHGFVPSEWLSKYASADNPLAVPLSAIVGVPLYIRAEAMVGLAPALIDKGVSMGSILALTIAGAGASLPEMIMLKKIFKLPIMIFFIFTVFFMAITCGYLVNAFI